MPSVSSAPVAMMVEVCNLAGESKERMSDTRLFSSKKLSGVPAKDL